MTTGFATAEGTTRFAARFASARNCGSFGAFHTLQISSLGLGTYLGNMDEATDRAYHQAIVAENLQLARVPCLAAETHQDLFQRA